MSLKEDIQAWYQDAPYPPSPLDVDANRVSFEYGETRRWGIEFSAVYQRDNEYVEVFDVEPATEMQYWGDYGDPAIYEVKPVEVTVIKYERV